MSNEPRWDLSSPDVAAALESGIAPDETTAALYESFESEVLRRLHDAFMRDLNDPRLPRTAKSAAFIAGRILLIERLLAERERGPE